MNGRSGTELAGDEDISPWLVAASTAAGALLLLLAAVVLLGLPLPHRSSGAGHAAAVPVIGAPRDQAATPLPLLTAVPIEPPFVLRPPAPLVDLTVPVVPGSEAATIAATPACVVLRTERGPSGFFLGDGLLDMIARAHPECP